MEIVLNYIDIIVGKLTFIKTFVKFLYLDEYNVNLGLFHVQHFDLVNS